MQRQWCIDLRFVSRMFAWLWTCCEPRTLNMEVAS